MNANLCFICSSNASMTCQACNNVNACCSEHLNLHCREEEGTCYPYAIRSSPELGRHLVAAKNIYKGDTICKEDPLVVAPNQDTAPICLSCMAAIDCSYLCSDCGYPFCDSECASTPLHVQECAILAKGGKPTFIGDEVNTEAYHAIMPLRLLKLLATESHWASFVSELVDHRAGREKGEYWETSQEHVVRKLREHCGQRNWSEDVIQAIVGRLEMNSYEIHSYITAGYRGIFPVGALTNHSCIPNSYHIWTKEPPFTSTLVATQNIKEGDAITVTYLPSIMCSLRRMKTLNESWFFQCKCPRCQDVLEAGAETNTLNCPSCRSSRLLPIEALNWKSNWQCENCGHQKLHQLVSGVVDEYLKETNYLVTNDRGPGKNFADFSQDLLQIKVNLGKDYLDVLNIVEAGLSRNRAKTMFEIVDTQLYLSSIESRQGLISKEEMSERMLKYDKDSEEIEWILSVLRPMTGYEELVVMCVANVRRECALFLGRQTGFSSHFSPNES